MKILFMVLILSFPFDTYALTVDELVKQYGKYAIMDVISSRIKNKFTIYASDGSQQFIAAPNLDLITSETLTIDIARSGLNVNVVETAIIAKLSEAKAEEKKLEELKIRLNQAMAKKEQKNLQISEAEEKNIRIKEALKILAANRERYKERDLIDESEKRVFQRTIDEKKQAEVSEKYGSQSIYQTDSTLTDNPTLSTTDKLDSWRNASSSERARLTNIIVDNVDKPDLKPTELNDCISEVAGDGGLDFLSTSSIASACMTLQNK